MFITKRLHRLVSFFLSFTLIFQTFSPALIYAQGATQSADVPTETVSPTPTTEITPEVIPTETQSTAVLSPDSQSGPTEEPSPTIEPTPTPEVTVTSNPTPESTTTPSSDPTQTPTPTETQSTAVLSPDSQSGPTEEVTPAPTPEPTPAITETTSLIAKVFTDKLDYAPTDTVTVNGTDFAPFQIYSLIIFSSDYPGVSYFDTVFTDGAGNFTYQRPLDGNYRPNYSVEVRDAAGTILASTTFTDSKTVTVLKNGSGSGTVTSSQPNFTINCGAICSASLGNNDQVTLNATPDSGSVISGWDVPTGYTINSGCGTSDSSCQFTMNNSAKTIIVTFDLSVTPTPTPTATPTPTPTPTPTGNSSADLDQCANGAVDSPVNCTGSAWQNGNVNEQHAHYREGDSVPYRFKMSGVGSGSHTITLEWDTTKSGKHALDYITTYNRTEILADPCSDVVGCGSPSIFAIPAFPGAVNQVSGVFTLFNGTITGVSAYSVSGTDNSAKITVTFTASSETPVLAVGGHIGSQIDWGENNAAGAVPGSPYHMRLIDIDGGGGNQDRSLAAGAILLPPTVVTQVSNSAIYLSNSVSDLATFSGNSGAISGTVNFFVCGPTTPGCTTGGTQVGTTKLISNNQATSDPFTPTQLGDYCFRAEYAPDSTAQYSPTNHTNTTTECFTVSNPPTGTVIVIKDVLNPDGNSVDDTHSFSVTVGSQTDSTFGEGDNATFTLDAGIYTVSEGVDGNYDFVSVSEDSDAAAGYQVHLNPGEQKTITIFNKQKKAHITVIKDVVKSDLSHVADNHTFYVTVDGTQKPFAEGSNAVFDVNPGGPYGAIEVSDGNYTWVSQDGPVTIGSNGSGTINIVNKQNPGTISGYKYDDTSDLGISGWTIKLSGTATISTTTNANGFFTFTNLVTGPYTVTEDQPAGWTPTGVTSYNVTVNPGDQKTGNNFTNFQNISITACKQVDTDGGLETSNDRTNKSGWGVTLSDGQITDPQTTGVDGCYTWTNKGPGNYIVTEETPTGWVNLTPTTHDFGTAQSGQNLSYTFVNRISGSIEIIKNAITNDDQDFTFTSPQFGTFYLDDDGNEGNTYKKNREFLDLGNNTYTITESVVSGWKLSNLACTGGTERIDLNNRSVAITIDQPGQAVVCTFTNTKLGSIQIVKNTVGGDATFNFTATGGSNLPSSINLGTSNGSASVTYNYIDPDLTYSIGEDGLDGWSLTDSSCTGTNTPDEITPNAGEEVVCTFTNTRDTGTITIVKNVDNNNDGDVADEGDVQGAIDWTWNVENGEQGISTGIDKVLDTGDYVISETDKDNYHLVSWECDNDSSGEENSIDISLTTDSVTCTITNARDTGTISGYKWNDLNGDREWDENESGLGNWKIDLKTDNDGQPGSLISTATTSTGDNLGAYNFSNIPTGNYFVCEQNQDGWDQTAPLNQTGNCHPVSLLRDAQTISGRDFGNQAVPPSLTLTKSNNAGGDKNPGGSVTYTLTLYVLGNNVTNATVTDLLPKGFKYRSGSWLATLNSSPLILPNEPTYHSPGTWTLGDLPKDAIVTLTYVADIDANEDPGLYKDLAWAKATDNDDTIYAIGTDGNFVGTEVNIAKNQQDTPGVNVINETIVDGQVLGASTDLPATGANSNILLLAILGLITGISLSGIGSYLKKKYE